VLLPVTTRPQIAKLPTAAEYEAVNKPYQAPKEKLPTMSENWACVLLGAVSSTKVHSLT